MPTFKATVNVSLQPGILDPKGKAAKAALEQLGFSGVEEVRINKSVELKISAPTHARAEEIADAAARKLLANPVTESFSLTVV